MTEDRDLRYAVDRFIQDRIDSVPHLEALLLLWNTRPKPWPIEEMAQALFIDANAAKLVLQDLVRHKLAAAALQSQPECYAFLAESHNQPLMTGLAKAYRRDLIRITRIIHSKPAAAVREFARAFRFTKESG